MAPEVLLRLAFGFDPVASMVGAVAAAMLFTRARRAPGYALACAVLVVAWAFGEGLAESLLSGGLAAQAARTGPWTLALGSAGALAIGYAFPAWAGSFVGRRVTFGTGWLSAAVVAATASWIAGVFSARVL